MTEEHRHEMTQCAAKIADVSECVRELVHTYLLISESSIVHCVVLARRGSRRTHEKSQRCECVCFYCARQNTE